MSEDRRKWFSKSNAMGLMVGVATLILGALILGAVEKPSQWNKTTETLNRIAPEVDDHEKQLNILKTQVSDTREDVKEIKRDLEELLQRRR